MKPVLEVVVVAVLSCLTMAQEPAKPSDDPVEKVRAAYQAILDTRAKGRKEVEVLKEEVKRLPPESAERRAVVEKLNNAARASKAPLTPFLDVLADTDWSKFDTAADNKLLKEGLAGLAVDLERGDKAIAASRHYLELFAAEPVSVGIRVRHLPLALLRAGRIDEARKELRLGIDQAKDQVKGSAALLLGDIESVLGNFDDAKKAFAEAAACGKVLAEFAACRVALIGKPRPPLEVRQWVGSEPLTDADTQGKVQLLGFWASWAPPARAATRQWNAMRDELAAQGLVCIGICKLWGHGYLPNDESELENGGSSYQGMKPETYFEHVQKFHTNLKLHFPTAIVDEAAYANFAIKPLPQVELVGRDGKVRLVTTAPLDDRELVRFAVRHLLAEK